MAYVVEVGAYYKVHNHFPISIQQHAVAPHRQLPGLWYTQATALHAMA